MSSPRKLNISKLSALLRTQRGSRGLREVAQEIREISASTLSRVEQGHIPDLDTFMRLCSWLKISPEHVYDGTENESPIRDTPTLIEAHLRAEQVLPPDTIAALSKMIQLAYKAAEDQNLAGEKPKE